MIDLLGNYGKSSSFCDNQSRREFIKIGGMAAGGLAMSQVLEMEARAGTGSSPKSIINIFLPGGPSHIDMFDMKPDAPREVRGEFKPI